MAGKRPLHRIEGIIYTRQVLGRKLENKIKARSVSLGRTDSANTPRRATQQGPRPAESDP